jgi:hypothetical protein
MAADWRDRPVEEQRLFNPAFVALVLRQTADGYASVALSPLPIMLALLAPAVLLHRHSREALPYTTSTDLLIWMQEHPDIRFLAAARARRLAPFVKEAVLFGSAAGVLQVDARGIAIGPARVPVAAIGRIPHEAGECFNRARHVGRWMARSGSLVYQLSLWGIAP